MALLLRKEWFGGLVGDPHTYNLRVLNHFAFNQIAAEISCGKALSANTMSMLRAAGLAVNVGELPTIIRIQTDESDALPLSAPVIFWLELTSRCPLRCKHCFIRPSINDKSKHLPTQLAMSLVRQAREMGIYKVTLTGGEALLHPDAYEIIGEINGLGLGLRIFSSGVLKPSFYQRLAEYRVDTFFLSMDGMKEHHQFIRGRKSFEQLTRTIDMLSAIRSISNITLSITLDRMNAEYVDEIVSFASAHRVRTLLVRPIMAYAWTPDVSGFAFTDKSALLNALETLESVGKQYGVECQINKLPYFPFAKNTFIDDHENNASLWNILGIERSIDCVGGNLVCGVRWDGTISPCGFLPSHQQTTPSAPKVAVDLSGEWRNSPLLRGMRDIPANQDCNSCAVQPICNGGCRANSMLAGTGIDGIDPYCLLHDTAYGHSVYGDHGRVDGENFPANEDVFFVSHKNLVSKCGWATYEF